MTAPFILNDVISVDSSLWLAILIGIGMGFFLERAGFGSAKKLAAQFFLYDMTVFKVMFIAIVTAMVGIFLLSSTGFLDLDQVSMVGTFVWPQVIGGLILGVGFVVGGYCPGTPENWMRWCLRGALSSVCLSLAKCIHLFNVS